MENVIEFYGNYQKEILGKNMGTTKDLILEKRVKIWLFDFSSHKKGNLIYEIHCSCEKIQTSKF
jgi:hypothetical protein